MTISNQSAGFFKVFQGPDSGP